MQTDDNMNHLLLQTPVLSWLHFQQNSVLNFRRSSTAPVLYKVAFFSQIFSSATEEQNRASSMDQH